LNDVINVSRLGDAVIEAVGKGDFAAATNSYKEIDRAITKWESSFK
jgi:predicted translin family RNA/ssDNA-binding protein